jgi:hypothetical protein
MPGFQVDSWMHLEGRQIADVHRRDHVPSHHSRLGTRDIPTPRQEHGENDGYVGVDTNCIPINNLLRQTRGMKRASPSRSARSIIIKLDHNLSTSSRPDHFHDTRVCSLVSRHHIYGLPLWEPWDFRSSSGHLPRSAPIDSGLAVAAVCL